LQPAKLPENGLTGFLSPFPDGGIEGRRPTLILGNHRLIEDRGLCRPEIEARFWPHETQGRTVTCWRRTAGAGHLRGGRHHQGKLAGEAVADLHRLGVVSVMLTGDNVATAPPALPRRPASTTPEAICSRGQAGGHRRLAASLWPDRHDRRRHQRRTGAARRYRRRWVRPDRYSMEAADVVIMNDDLRRIPETIRLSRSTHAVLWQNIGTGTWASRRLSRFGHFRQRHHVDGGVCRHGRQPAGGLQRPAPVAQMIPDKPMMDRCRWLGWPSVVALADQGVKHWIVATFPLGTGATVLPFFNLCSHPE
jgi:hypothetical protein